MTHYQDPGIRMVEEFHKAFECHRAPEPMLPVLSEDDRDVMAGVAHSLDNFSKALKAAAASANLDGRTGLGLALIRIQLHLEEGCAELATAFAEGDLPKALDALSDASYVVDGTYLTLGLGAVKPAADEEVHRSNMSKLGEGGRPILSDAGRVIKGPNYVPADFVKVLAEHRLRLAEQVVPPEASLVEPWG